MKYQKALRNKIDRIIKYVEEEVRVGKCSESDIIAITDAIRDEVEAYRRIATPASTNSIWDTLVGPLELGKDGKPQTITFEELDYLWQKHHGTSDPSSLTWTPAQIDAEVEMQILRMKEDPF